MKKIFLLLTIGFVLVLGACNTDADYITYTITFETNGGSLVNDEIVILEDSVTRPSDPLKDGYTFDGWYSNSSLITTFNFGAQTYSDQTIYAKWLYAGLTDLEKLAEAMHALEISLETSTDLVLPAAGLHDSVITWESSNISTIANDGTINRPILTEGNKIVTMTAQLSIGDDILTKIFIVSVLAVTEYNIFEKIELAKENLDLVGETSNDIVLPLVELYDVVIYWESSNTDIIANDGTVTRPLFSEGDTIVTMMAFLTLGDETLVKLFYVTVLAENEYTDAELAQIGSEMLIIPNSTTVESDIVLPNQILIDNLFTATITWESSHVDVISITGTVIRPFYGKGNQVVTLTASITVGVETKTKDFTIVVIQEEIEFFLNTILEIHQLNLDDALEFKGIVISIFDYGYIMTDGVNAIGVYNLIPNDIIAVGDEVIVKGYYSIYNSLYQIFSSNEEEILSSNNPVVLTPTVLTIEELLALDSTDKLIHGLPYTITGTVEIRGDYNNVYIVDGDNAVFISYFSLEDSLALLEDKVGQEITITVNYYVDHAINGVMVIFDGNESDIVVIIPDDTPLFTVDELDMLAGLASLFSITPDPIEVSVMGTLVNTTIGIDPLIGYRNMDDEEIINILDMNTVSAPEYYEIIGTYNDSLSDIHSYLAVILPVISIFTEFETTYEVGGFTFIIHRLSDTEYQILVTGQVYSQDISLEIVIENVNLFDEYMYYIEFTTPIVSWHYEINRDVLGINSILEIKEFYGDNVGVVYLNQFVFDGDSISGFIFKDEITITRRMYFEFTDESNSIYYLNDDTGTEKYILLDLEGNLIFEYEDYLPNVPLFGSAKARWALDQLGGYSTIEFIDGLFSNDYLIDATVTIDEGDSFSVQAKDYIIVTYDDVEQVYNEEVAANWFYRIDGTWADDRAGLFTLESFFTTLFTIDVQQSLEDLEANKDAETVFDISILTVTKEDVLDYLAE